jgi:hypothetical protein
MKSCLLSGSLCVCVCVDSLLTIGLLLFVLLANINQYVC